MNNDQPDKTEWHPSEEERFQEPVEQPTDADSGSTLDFPIVGIGASAGGLAAFERFFSNLDPDMGPAYVVIQHLSPVHTSILPEILQRYTTMHVFQVTDGVEVKSNCVYVIPPGNNIALLDGHLVLIKTPEERGYRFPIDFFFRSLAQACKEQAIGVVLSGTANDGSLGIRAIKSKGGLTIAQEPGTAEYYDMPHNAIATQDVDFVLPPEKMGDLIFKVVRHQTVSEYRTEVKKLAEAPVGALKKLYALLQVKTGHDFTFYKQNTMLRRVERRIKITLVADLEAYIDYLQQHPEEVAALFQDMLINVTQFFRDPEAFHSLVEKGIQPLIQMKSDSQAPLRIWVAGCSSGEEAYSIAIAAQEQIEALRANCKVQIYGTDLDENAIITARRAVYSDGSLENVSPEQLQRFFIQEDEGYRIKKNIRDQVVFSTQNLIHDPPLSKMDLVCCRNLLIYLEPELQKQLFPLFHYALSPGGVLFLGTSETIGSFTNLFSVLDRKYKIYRRKGTATQHYVKTQVRSTSQAINLTSGETGIPRLFSVELREWTEKTLLKFHAPACVIIDSKHEILYIHGRTGKYLEPTSGQMSTNILRMAREGLKADLATAVHAAAANNETVSIKDIRVKTNGDYEQVNLTVRPVDYGTRGTAMLMVVFEEVQNNLTEDATAEKKPTDRNQQVADLEKALKDKDDYLNSIINELEVVNQDLKSMNEELQSSNEEMQSTNEELETSKEELQSINEELNTVNAELQNKNSELTALNNDVYNLLASTEIGMIFLDLDLQLRRYTPAIKHIFNFRPGDIGRPLAHFLSNLHYDDLLRDVQEVLYTLIPKSVEAQSKNGTWYLVSIKLYRTIENIIDGAVVTFVDITRQKHNNELQRLATVIRDSNDAITVQDFEGKILAWNRGAAAMYGWSEDEALQMNALEMIPEPLRQETKELYQQLLRGESVRSFETRRNTRGGSVLDVWVTISLLVNDLKRPIAIATTERDITDRKRASQQIRFENRALKTLNAWYTQFEEQAFSSALLKEICRLVVEEGGYCLAWISLLGGRPAGHPLVTGQVRAKEQNPLSQKTVDALARRSHKLAEQALHRRRSVVARNILGDSSYKRWHAEAQKFGYNSLIMLPLIMESQPLGVLAIYAAEPEAFIEQEIETLIRLSERIAKKMGSGSQDE